MEKKIYRLSSSKFGIFLYPTPIDKKSLFLINAPSLSHAQLYKHLLDFGAISSPLDFPELYHKSGTHVDGVTPIFDLNWDQLQLKFLPHRELDLERATTIENLFSRKFQKLFQNIDKKREFIKDIQFRFSQQQLCSECQKLGISDSKLLAWFNELQNLVS